MDKTPESNARIPRESRDTSVAAILARHGEELLSPEEFDRHFGSLPADAEG